MTLSQTWTVPEGVTINLCLNGFIINLMSGTNGSVIKVGSGATLNLYDCHNNGMITGGTGTLDVDTTSTMAAVCMLIMTVIMTSTVNGFPLYTAFDKSICISGDIPQVAL